MEYLSPDQIPNRSERCMAAVKSLLAVKTLAGKPNARQWKFFRDAVERLIFPDGSSEFQGISPVRAAQLKFEVEDKLRRFYLRPGRSQEFVFTLVHQSELSLYGVEDSDPYPRLAGYCVLVRDLSEDRVGEADPGPDDSRRTWKKSSPHVSTPSSLHTRPCRKSALMTSVDGSARAGPPTAKSQPLSRATSSAGG